jgi:hypothetical protein
MAKSGSKLAEGAVTGLARKRGDTPFKREFKAFLAVIGVPLKRFLPDGDLVKDEFPDCTISHATGYEKLRGQGNLSPDIALRWAKRCERFLAEAVSNAAERGRKLSFEGISFVEVESGQPRVNWKKLIFLYEVEKLIPIRIKIGESVDDATVEEILAKLKEVAGDTQIVVARVREGCTEITIRVSREKADEILRLFASRRLPDTVDDVVETIAPAEGSIDSVLVLDGPPIDLARGDALQRFEPIWRRALRLEALIRPWRRLRWLVSPSIHKSPIARVLGDSNGRAYAADLRGKGRALKADLEMAWVTWPLFAVVVLTLFLAAIRPVFPYLDIGAGIATALAISLIGVQVCSSAISPIACGAGTIAVIWAFGITQAFAIGGSGGGAALSRANIQQDFFISLTGGIVGLTAPDWRSRIPTAVIVLLLIAIPCAIAVTGWLMAQPVKAGAAPAAKGRRVVLGALAGSCMGAGIGLVRLLSKILAHFGCPQGLAVIAAFIAIGTATFAFTIRLRMPGVAARRLVSLVSCHALVAAAVCGLAYANAGEWSGLLALAGATGWYHATWFTGASVVGNRIGSARAAVIATTLEGAVGFTGFVVFRLLHG